MSVQTQIDRISGNVAAALSAIAEKGVTVPSGSTSDALAELIAAIEAGGGEELTELNRGSFTLTESRNIYISNSNYDNGYIVTHNSGKIPKVVLASGANTTTYELIHFLGFRVFEKSSNSSFMRCLTVYRSGVSATGYSLSAPMVLDKTGLWDENVFILGSSYGNAKLNTNKYIWYIYA